MRGGAGGWGKSVTGSPGESLAEVLATTRQYVRGGRTVERSLRAMASARSGSIIQGPSNIIPSRKNLMYYRNDRGMEVRTMFTIGLFDYCGLPGCGP
jgi:hypothetical protein